MRFKKRNYGASSSRTLNIIINPFPALSSITRRLPFSTSRARSAADICAPVGSANTAVSRKSHPRFQSFHLAWDKFRSDRVTAQTVYQNYLGGMCNQTEQGSFLVHAL